MSATDLWGRLPGLTATVALCLLALDELQRTDSIEAYTTVDEVAALTGLNAGTAGASLRQLAKAGLVDKVPYLDVDKRGRDIARPGYRLPAKGGE